MAARGVGGNGNGGGVNTTNSIPVGTPTHASSNYNGNSDNGGGPNGGNDGTPLHPIRYSTRGHDAPLLLEGHSALQNGNDPDRIRLLLELHADDREEVSDARSGRDAGPLEH